MNKEEDYIQQILHELLDICRRSSHIDKGTEETGMENIAHQFVEAIKTIAEKPENLDNLECYLSHHFDVWLEKWADTPEGLTYEMKAFAEMEI